MEFLGFFFVMLGLLKFLSTSKMFIMMMSLEMCSIFLFFLLVLTSPVSNIFTGFYSVFLVLVVCEGVTVLLSMVSIFRKGSMMVKSLYALKF